MDKRDNSSWKWGTNIERLIPGFSSRNERPSNAWNMRSWLNSDEPRPVHRTERGKTHLFPLRDEAIEQTGIVERLVEIAVTGRVPAVKKEASENRGTFLDSKIKIDTEISTVSRHRGRCDRTTICAKSETRFKFWQEKISTISSSLFSRKKCGRDIWKKMKRHN